MLINSALIDCMLIDGTRMKTQETAVLLVAVSFPPSFC
jgi:hypothetical protein